MDTSSVIQLKTYQATPLKENVIEIDYLVSLEIPFAIPLAFPSEISLTIFQAFHLRSHQAKVL